MNKLFRTDLPDSGKRVLVRLKDEADPLALAFHDGETWCCAVTGLKLVPDEAPLIESAEVPLRPVYRVEKDGEVFWRGSMELAMRAAGVTDEAAENFGILITAEKVSPAVATQLLSPVQSNAQREVAA